MFAEIIRPMPCITNKNPGQVLEENVKRIFLMNQRGFVKPIVDSMNDWEKYQWRRLHYKFRSSLSPINIYDNGELKIYSGGTIKEYVPAAGGYPDSILFYWNCDISGGAGPYTPTIGNNVTKYYGTDAVGSTGRGIEDAGAENATGGMLVNVADIDITVGKMVIYARTDNYTTNGGKWLLKIGGQTGNFYLQQQANSGDIWFYYGNDIAKATGAFEDTVSFIKITLIWRTTTLLRSISINDGTPVESTAGTAASGTPTSFYLSGGIWNSKWDGVYDEVWIANDTTTTLPYVP